LHDKLLIATLNKNRTKKSQTAPDMIQIIFSLRRERLLIQTASILVCLVSGDQYETIRQSAMFLFFSSIADFCILLLILFFA